MTRAEHLFSILTELDDDLIEEAALPLSPAQTPSAAPSPRTKKVIRWKPWAAVAACLLLVVGIWRFFPRMGSTNEAAPPTAAEPSEIPPSSFGPSASSAPEEPGSPGEGMTADGSGNGSGTGELPILKLSDPKTLLGRGNIWINDLDDYLSDAIDPELISHTMPVYATIDQTDVAGCPTQEANLAAMNALLDELLSRFGRTQEDCTIEETTTPMGNLTEEVIESGQGFTTRSFTATTEDGVQVTVNWELTASIRLPAHYWSALAPQLESTCSATPAEAECMAQQLLEELAWLLNIEEPAFAVIGGDSNRYGEIHYRPVIYDGIEDPLFLTQTKVTFTLLEEYDALVLHLDTRSSPALVGNYPVISMEEAAAELMAGGWVDWAEGYDPPTEEQFLRGEMTYLTLQNGLLMPYYRFYLDRGTTIALSALNEDGTSTPTGEELPSLLCLYVPAIDRDYLKISSDG